MPLHRERQVLAHVVGDEIEVPRPGPRALGLRPLDPVLEAKRIPDARLAGHPEAEDVLRRLDEDRHLVAVVLAAMMEAVNRRADGAPKDGAALDEFESAHRSSLI